MLTVKEALTQDESGKWLEFMANSRRPPSYCFSSLTAWDQLRAESEISGNGLLGISKKSFSIIYSTNDKRRYGQALCHVVDLPGRIGRTLDIYGLTILDFDAAEVKKLIDELLVLARRMNAASVRFLRTQFEETDSVSFRTLLRSAGFEMQLKSNEPDGAKSNGSSDAGDDEKGTWIQTGVVNLAKSPEELLASFRDTTRHSIRKAIRSGGYVRVGNDPADLKAFYDMFAEMHRRKGKGMDLTPVAMFNALRDRITVVSAFGSTGNLKAAAVLLEDGTTARYNWGASDASPDGATQLALFEAMKWARERGLKYYDVGGIPLDPTDPLLKGIKVFKEGFRGAPVRSLVPSILILRPRLHKSVGLAKSVVRMLKQQVRNRG